jgi:hypothetical protein
MRADVICKMLPTPPLGAIAHAFYDWQYLIDQAQREVSASYRNIYKKKKITMICYQDTIHTKTQ